MTVERVTFVCVSEVLGGGELSLLRTAQAASAQVEVAVAGTPGTPVLEAACEAGLIICDLPLGRKLGRRTAATSAARFPLARRRLVRFLEGTRSGEWTLFQYKWEELLWAGDVAAERVALWEHGPIPPALLRLPWARRRLTRAFRAAGAVFAWSEPARTSIVTLCERPAVMLSAGVDEQRALAAIEAREATRAHIGVTPEQSLFVFIGRVTEDKGVFDLIRALPALEGSHGLICGDGPDRTRVEKLARDLGVADRTHFQGFVADTLPYLAAGDVTVLLSRSPGEGRPVVAIESNAVATPVLGRAGSPALEELARRGLACLVAGSEPQTVARGIEVLLAQPRRQIPAPNWKQTAGTFLDELRNRHRAVKRNSLPGV